MYNKIKTLLSIYRYIGLYGIITTVASRMGLKRFSQNYRKIN